MATAAVLLASVFGVKAARADKMDPAIERLTLPISDGKGGMESCSNNGAFRGNISPQVVAQCSPDNVAFGKLIAGYAMVMAPTAMHSARTTGYGGFQIGFEGAITTIDSGASYWQNGTRGPADPSSNTFSTKNENPASALGLYSLKVTKGFPFGLELSGSIGYIAQTSMVSTGADIRMALLEGFRTGPLGYFPDIAAGGGVRTITGTSQFNLTVASFDAQISKPIPIADSSILTPYAGFQYLWIFGDAAVVDSTPKTNALGYCGYTGPNVPGNPDPAKVGTNGQQIYDGQPVCKTGSPLDFNNSFVFDNVRINRMRIIGGLIYRYEFVFVGLQGATDAVKPEDAGGRDNKSKLAGMPRQTTYSFSLGASF